MSCFSRHPKRHLVAIFWFRVKMYSQTAAEVSFTPTSVVTSRRSGLEPRPKHGDPVGQHPHPRGSGLRAAAGLGLLPEVRKIIIILLIYYPPPPLPPSPGFPEKRFSCLRLPLFMSPPPSLHVSTSLSSCLRLPLFCTDTRTPSSQRYPNQQTSCQT